MNALRNLNDSVRGALLAVLANLIWGFAALYWIQTEPVNPVDLLAHRAAWSVPVLALMLWLTGGLGTALRLIGSPRTLAIMAGCATLCATNWGIFLWAITNGQAGNASLGYFLLPLVNVMIGLTFFGERLDRSRLLAVCCAVLALGVLIADQGGLPLVALGVSLSFGIYAAVRKGVSVEPVPGLLIETLLMLPFALAWLWYRDGGGMGMYGLRVDLFLLGSGVLTVVPLIASVAGSRLMPLTVMGLVFYIGPSAQLLVAITVLDEQFEPVRLMAFGLVWLGLVLYTASTLHQLRSMKS